MLFAVSCAETPYMGTVNVLPFFFVDWQPYSFKIIKINNSFKYLGCLMKVASTFKIYLAYIISLVK